MIRTAINHLSISGLKKLIYAFNNRSRCREIAGTYSGIFFIVGSPRTGSTLLSQIINAHPSCICTTEFQLERHYLTTGSIDKSLQKMVAEGLYQKEFGLEKHPKFGKTLSRFQERWVSLPKSNTASRIHVIGDKPLGRFVRQYKHNPKDIEALLSRLNKPKFIHLIRHPFKSAASLMRSHAHQFGSVEDALSFVVETHELTVQMLESLGCDSLTLYYEDMLKDTDPVLESIETFLNLPHNKDWRSSMLTVINARDRPNADQIDSEDAKAALQGAIFSRYQTTNK